MKGIIYNQDPGNLGEEPVKHSGFNYLTSHCLWFRMSERRIIVPVSRVLRELSNYQPRAKSVKGSQFSRYSVYGRSQLILLCLLTQPETPENTHLYGKVLIL